MNTYVKIFLLINHEYFNKYVVDILIDIFWIFFEDIWIFINRN